MLFNDVYRLFIWFAQKMRVACLLNKNVFLSRLKFKYDFNDNDDTFIFCSLWSCHVPCYPKTGLRLFIVEQRYLLFGVRNFFIYPGLYTFFFVWWTTRPLTTNFFKYSEHPSFMSPQRETMYQVGVKKNVDLIIGVGGWEGNCAISQLR